MSERTSTLFSLGCWAWQPSYHYTLEVQTNCLFDICGFPLPLFCHALYSYTKIIIAVVRGLFIFLFACIYRETRSFLIFSLPKSQATYPKFTRFNFSHPGSLLCILKMCVQSRSASFVLSSQKQLLSYLCAGKVYDCYDAVICPSWMILSFATDICCKNCHGCRVLQLLIDDKKYIAGSNTHAHTHTHTHMRADKLFCFLIIKNKCSFCQLCTV